LEKTVADKHLFYEAGKKTPGQTLMAKVQHFKPTFQTKKKRGGGGGVLLHLIKILPTHQQKKKCLRPFLPKAASLLREEPFADPDNLPVRSVPVKLQYCHAICRALVSGSDDTDQFKEVAESFHPKAVKVKENKHQQALIHLTRKIGAPPFSLSFSLSLSLPPPSPPPLHTHTVVASRYPSYLLPFQAAQYLSTSDRTIRKAALANLTETSISRPKVNLLLTELKEQGVDVHTPFENIGKHRWRSGKMLAQHLDISGNFPATTYSNVLSDEDGFKMCDFIADICSLGWKPNHVHEYECAGRQHSNPRLLRDVKRYPLWKLYQEEQDKRDAMLDAKAEAGKSSSTTADLEDEPKKKWRPGRGTFMLLVEHLTIEIKDKSCLSYYYVRMVQCFDDQVKFVDHLREIVLAADREWEDVYGNCGRCPCKPVVPPVADLVRKRREIKEVFSFAKHHAGGPDHMKVNKHDPCRFHCINHALGDCKEDHPAECFECGKLHRFGENLNRFHQVWCNLLCQAYEDHLPSFRKSSRTQAATSVDDAENTVPDYVGRKLKKDFNDGKGAKVYYGVVLASEVEVGTGAMLFRVKYSDGDEEDLHARELVDLLVPLEASDGVEDFTPDGGGDLPAGINRRRLYDLVRLAKHNSHVPVNWCAHQARFRHQDYHIEKEAEQMKAGNEFVRLCIDFKAKTLPSKRSTAQGEGMGLRGLSLAGGQFEFMRVAADGKKYKDRQQIHAIFDHGSKQQHDDTGRSLEAQLEWLAQHLSSPLRVRIRSDKCNNYCTHSQIPFIVEGNSRGWRRDGGAPLLRVESWTFSEAQCGKDQLDVNFSYVSKSFKSYVSGGKNLLTGKDMFEVRFYLPNSNSFCPLF
jgi:hypothetical protein